MRKRIRIILICIMLVVTCITLVFPAETVKASGTILYVGGTGFGNYTRIQDAIDNASDGFTIFVYNGTYYENIIVEKEIILKGENKNQSLHLKRREEFRRDFQHRLEKDQ